MKHLFLLAVCCAFFVAAKAQVPVLDIHNNRPFDVHFILHGDNGCGGSTSTGIITLPAGTHWNGLTPSSFSWSAFVPADFVFAQVFDGDPIACATATSTTIGETCGGFVQHDQHNHMDNTCTPWAPNPVPFDWNSTPGVHANLIFHP